MRKHKSAIIETVEINKEVSLLEQIESVRKPLAEAAKRAAWAGGAVAVDVTFHLGVLKFLEQLAGRIETLEDNVKNRGCTCGEESEGIMEEESPRVVLG